MSVESKISPTNSRKAVMEEIVNRKKMGDKKFHSESSLAHFGEDEDVEQPVTDGRDPGVSNTSINANHPEEVRRRTMSQPGPVSGGLVTATAARAARKKNVNYSADTLERSDSDRMPRLLIPNGDSGTATPTGDRSILFPTLYNGNYKSADTKSLNSYKYNSTNATPRKRSEVTMDAQSIRSVETHAPPPTTPQENKKKTKDYITSVSSVMYAILLVTAGLIIYIGDVFLDIPIASSYSLTLAGIGLIYHVYLIIDISRYKKAVLRNQKIKEQHSDKVAEYFRKQMEDDGLETPGNRSLDFNFRPMGFPPPQLLPVRHDYCFSHGRHSGSFYLKLGAAGFALGNLVHAILLITVQMGYLVDDTISNDTCVSYTQVAMDFMNPLYCFLQLFFVFKFSNVIIRKGQAVANIAFMHMIGSNLCFWISAIVRETVLGLTLYAQSLYGKYENNDTDTSYQTSMLQPDEYVSKFIDVSGLYDENCVGSTAISTIAESFSPYLYPFSVEFNILIVALYYNIWSSIDTCHNDEPENTEEAFMDDTYSVCKIPTANEENDYTSNLVIYANCHASNKGIFLGLLVAVMIIGMLIIGFVFSSVGGDFVGFGYTINNATKLGLHTLMLIAAIFTIIQTTKLDINAHPMSMLDDIFLFICLPPFFMETIFTLIATFTILNILKSIDFIVMVIQVLLQTALICDGLRRCSNSRKLRRSKPGRELIMFLIIANVGMWVFYTFSFKSPESLDERYAYYGKVLWSILGHVSLPLIMFYRFHSSVCFADIWAHAYKPGSEH